MSELYKDHRPKIFKNVIGQKAAVDSLNSLLFGDSFPSTLLFTGPSGCGKTTLARILQKKLDCGPRDFVEVNCADFRGIDMVRDIRGRMSLSPISGAKRIWLIDEAHQLTATAQDAFLKMLEDTPSHVHFFLATTDPQKLKKTIRTRSTEIAVKSLNSADLTELLYMVADKEGKELEEEVAERIVKHSDGSARKALVFLNQVIDLKKVQDQLNAINSSEIEKQGIELARALLDTRSNWKKVAAILKSINEDPESLRWMVLGYASNVMLSAGKSTARAFLLVDAFQDNFYDSKRAGLVAACYRVVVGE